MYEQWRRRSFYPSHRHGDVSFNIYNYVFTCVQSFAFRKRDTMRSYNAADRVVFTFLLNAQRACKTDRDGRLHVDIRAATCEIHQLITGASCFIARGCVHSCVQIDEKKKREKERKREREREKIIKGRGTANYSRVAC